MLLNGIKESNAKYFLLPKIRVYTYENSGAYINTIHKYLYFIELKYPESFKIIHSIGKEETCELAEFVEK
jgi:hypothetical protein